MALTTQQQALVNSAKAGKPVTTDQMTAAGFTLSTFNTAVMGVDNGAATAQAASSTPSTPSTPVTPVAPTPAPQALSATQQASNAIQQLQTYQPNTYNTLQTAGLLNQLQQQMISSNNFDAGTLAQPLLVTYQQQQTAAQQQAAQQAAAQQAAQVQAQQQAQAQAQAQAAQAAQQAAAAQAAQVQAQQQAQAQAQAQAAQAAQQAAAAQAAQVQAQNQATAQAQQAAATAAQQAATQQQAQIQAQNNTAGTVTPVDPNASIESQLNPTYLAQMQAAVSAGTDSGVAARDALAAQQQDANAAYVAAHPELQENTAAAIAAGEQANAAASQAQAAAENPDNTFSGLTNAIGNAFSSIGSFVDNNIPGGWATIGSAALLAVGVTNPDLLGLADSGTLTPEAVTNAGFDPATISTHLASGLTDGTIAPESVGLSTAPTVGADGTITTVASDGATTTATADGTVSTTAADGTVAPTTASGTASTGTVAPETGVPAETTPVAPDQTAALNTNQVGALNTPEPVPATPTNTISTTLPDGSVGSYDPATGTVYNADGSVNTAATNAAPNVGPGTEVAGPGGYDQKYTDLANAYQSNPSPENASALDEYLKSSGSDLTHNDFATFSSTAPEVPKVEMTSPVPPPETTPTEATPTEATPTNGGTTGTVDTTPVAPSETTGTTGSSDTGGSTGGGSNWSPLTVGGQTLTADQVAGSLDALAAQQATIAASGLTAAQVAALGGAAAAVAAISSMGAGGAAAAANSAIASSAGATPTAPGPTPTQTGPAWSKATVIANPVEAPVTTPTTEAPTAPGPSAPITSDPTTPIAPVTTPTTEAPPPLTPLQPGPANANPVGSPVTTTYTDPSTGDPVDTTGMSAAQIAAAVAAGYIAAKVLTTPTPSVQQNALPIPTYSAQNLVNPGVNPGFIQPAPAYGYQGAGMDQYYWGQHQYAQNMNDLANLNAPAPATPYGQVSQLGQLITPQQLGYPTAQSMAAAGLPYNSQVSVLPQDVYNNTVQMNTATPAVPGFAGAYGPNTLAQQSAGQGQGQLYGQGLNYAFVPPVIPVAPANN